MAGLLHEGERPGARWRGPRLAYELRSWMLVPPVLFAFLCTWWEVENHWSTFLPGGVLFAIGCVLLVWSQRHLHYGLRTHKTLTTTGPYAHVRNPIYLANGAMLLGAVCLSELLWFLPVMGAWWALVYGPVVRYEEAHLLEKYGAPYREYLERVPRFLPRPPGRRPDALFLSERLWFLPALGPGWARVYCRLVRSEKARLTEKEKEKDGAPDRERRERVPRPVPRARGRRPDALAVRALLRPAFRALVLSVPFVVKEMLG